LLSTTHSCRLLDTGSPQRLFTRWDITLACHIRMTGSITKHIDFGGDGDFYFSRSGDEANSMMSYIDLNWDFSQFDRDNMNRYMISVYLNQANTILADIYASSRAGQAGSLLTSADNHAAMALTAYADMDYAGAATHAKLAYEDVLAAAAQINVQVEPQSWQADYKAKGESTKFVDSVDYQRSKP